MSSHHAPRRGPASLAVNLVAVSAALMATTIAVPESSAQTNPALATNRPPLVQVHWPSRAVFSTASAVNFSVTVTDPDFDRVSARVVSGPDLMGFTRLENEPSGARREILWYPKATEGGRDELVIDAWDSHLPGRRVRFRFPYVVDAYTEARPLLVRDLDSRTGLEILARAQTASTEGVGGAGAFALFDSSPQPPNPRRDALTFIVPAYIGYLGSNLEPATGGGWSVGANLQVTDVTGDGKPDLIGMDNDLGGTVYVWSDPMTGKAFTRPTAELHSSDPDSGLRGAGGLNVVIEEVTGDAILDLVIAFPVADVIAHDEGEVLVFAGGPGLAGVAAPTAALRVAGAGREDRLGEGGKQGLRIGDVTGDGVRDVVVSAASVDRGTVKNVGRIYVWAGGAARAGAPAPTATLDPSANQNFGDGMSVANLVDASGDGLLDVVAASAAGPNGSIFVFNGGPTLHGTRDADATLTRSNAGNNMFQGWPFFLDVDLDGIDDVLVVSDETKVGGFKRAGEIDFWLGGALAGPVTQSGWFQRASPKVDDLLAYHGGLGLQVADVTGDGRDDIVAVSAYVDSAASNSGSVDVWECQAGLTGAVLPSASLEAPGASANDLLGMVDVPHPTNWIVAGTVLIDVTGDGVRDVVVPASEVDLSGTSDVGAIYVWAGGSGLTGGTTPLPLATLSIPGAPMGTRLASVMDTLPTINAGDLNGDGILDIAIPYDFDPSLGRVPTVAIWFGGAALAGVIGPAATASSVQADDHFGVSVSYNGFSEQVEKMVRLGDVTGDAVDDLVVPASCHDAGGWNNVGTLYVFAGSATASGPLAPFAMLMTAGSNDYDFLGNEPFLIRDVDEDGFEDVLAPVPSWRSSTSPGGALMWWRGPLSTASIPRALDAPNLGTMAGLGE